MVYETSGSYNLGFLSIACWRLDPLDASFHREREHFTKSQN